MNIAKKQCRNNQHYFSVKRIFLTLSCALAGVVCATAQSWSDVSKPMADTVVLSERTDGDYQIRQSLVSTPADAGYAVRYPINQATLQPSLDDNRRELGDLRSFVEALARDTLMNVRSVTIIGYASPDGPERLNKTLAANRAQNFRNYADKQYGLSKRYDVKSSSVASDWDACRSAVAQSDMPHRQEVLRVIDSRATRAEKEAQLKAMPAEVWDYLKTKILPPMRCVRTQIDYRDGRVIETRLLVARPACDPVPQQPQAECVPVAQPCTPCVLVDEQITGILIELDDEYAE